MCYMKDNLKSKRNLSLFIPAYRKAKWSMQIGDFDERVVDVFCQQGLLQMCLQN